MKLTNEKIEAFLDKIQNVHNANVEPSFIIPLLMELLEFRKLSEVSADLEKRIEEEAHKRFPSTIFGHYRTCFLQGAKWVIPIIRAESKAEIESLKNHEEFQNNIIGNLSSEIASLTEQVKIAEEALNAIAKEELLFEHEGSPSSKRNATIAKNKVFKALSKIKALRAKGETGEIENG